ncbi:septum formation family protein [Arthrobacter agilis]|uniref:septum formation family protein n=1 Tax=Arthrobacter agilis TaxID=37921 RepID=UPI00277E9BBA|nr:septum formation family protein [Arthrobacter agilis]MDQ0736092.1 hypothetical protein [Arthrobacter agilis]
MSNEEQAQRESGRGPVPDRRDGTDGPAVVDPDDVVLDDGSSVLDDGDVAVDALEPELSVSPETLDLDEPALEPARISTDTAAAASLDEAAAEARAVAAEAEETGTLVGGPMPADAPLVHAAPEGTAPAGGAAGDTDAATGPAPDPAPDAAPGTVAGADAGSPGASVPEVEDPAPHSASGPGDGPAPGSDAGEPAGGPYAFQPQGGEPGDGHPGLYPGTDPAFIGAGGAAGSGGTGATGSAGTTGASEDSAGRGSTSARAGWVPEASGGTEDPSEGLPLRDRTRTSSSKAPLLLVIGGAVVLLGLLVWLLVTLFGGSDDEGRTDPSSIAAGECLADFTAITEDAARVDCSEPHNAQLVASESYPDDAEFPGRDQLGLRAEAACESASAGIDPEAVTEDLQVTLLRATPTTETWADGDRRVDCFAVVENDGTLSRSLLGP